MSLVKSFDNAESTNFEKSKMKFKTAYFITKEKLPISKFKKIHAMEVKHGMQLGEAYAINDICWYHDKFHREQYSFGFISFFSFLMDGSINAIVIEKEAIFVVVFSFSPTPYHPPPLKKNKKKTNEIKVEIIYLDLADFVTANAKFIIWAIDFSFESISFENWHSKLLGYGSDVASITCGKKEGVKTIFQNDC